MASLTMCLSVVAACDSGLDWSEKAPFGRQHPPAAAAAVPAPIVPDRSSWPGGARLARAQNEDKEVGGAGWPFGADATSFAATITWHKMEPKNGGSVFVSNFLNEGCGSG